jgi:peptidyl-prolyl cis-trans isomerase C
MSSIVIPFQALVGFIVALQFFDSPCALARESTKKKNAQKQQVQKKESSNQTSLPSSKQASWPNFDKINQNLVVLRLKDGKEVTFREVLPFLKSISQESNNIPFQVAYQEVLGLLVLIHKAKSSGTSNDSEYKLELEKLKQKLLARSYLDHKITARIAPNDIQKTLATLKEEYKTDNIAVNLNVVRFKSQQEALSIAEKLKKGEMTWDEALKNGIDREALQNKGALGMYVSKRQLPKECIQAIFEGPLTDDPLSRIRATSFGDKGWGVVYINDKRPLPFPTPEDAKRRLKQEKEPAYLQEIVIQMQKKNPPKLYNWDGKPLPQTPKGPQISKPPADETILNPKAVIVEFKNGEKITLGDLMQDRTALPPEYRSAPFSDIYEFLLQERIIMMQSRNEARQNQFEKSQDFIEKYTNASNSLMIRFFAKKIAKGTVKKEEIQETYNKIASANKDKKQVRYRAIVLETEQEGKNVLDSLKKGQKFEDLVKTHSKDKMSVERAGDMGYVIEDNAPKELWSVLKDAKAATLIPHVVPLFGKYFIIRVEDKKLIEVPKFEEMKDRLESIIEQQKVPELLNNEKNDPQVHYFDLSSKEFKPVPPEQLIQSLQAQQKKQGQTTTAAQRNAQIAR